MNERMQDFARRTLIEEVNKLPAEPNQRVFKLAFGRDGGKRSVEDAKNMTIESVVFEIPEEDLSQALDLVDRTIKANNAARA